MEGVGEGEEEAEEHLKIAICAKGKVVLEESCHLQRLHRLLEGEREGGNRCGYH